MAPRLRYHCASSYARVAKVRWTVIPTTCGNGSQGGGPWSRFSSQYDTPQSDGCRPRHARQRQRGRQNVLSEACVRVFGIKRIDEQRPLSLDRSGLNRVIKLRAQPAFPRVSNSEFLVGSWHRPQRWQLKHRACLLQVLCNAKLFWSRENTEPNTRQSGIYSPLTDPSRRCPLVMWTGEMAYFGLSLAGSHAPIP